MFADVPPFHPVEEFRPFKYPGGGIRERCCYRVPASFQVYKRQALQAV